MWGGLCRFLLPPLWCPSFLFLITISIGPEPGPLSNPHLPPPVSPGPPLPTSGNTDWCWGGEAEASLRVTAHKHVRDSQVPAPLHSLLSTGANPFPSPNWPPPRGNPPTLERSTGCREGGARISWPWRGSKKSQPLSPLPRARAGAGRPSEPLRAVLVLHLNPPPQGASRRLAPS